MKIAFAGNEAFDSFYAWTINDKKNAKKIAELIRDIQRDPYNGLGKPLTPCGKWAAKPAWDVVPGRFETPPEPSG
jgi:Txe/YoeB family toxin of Txe-Axe toxin-antitoxin module